MRTSPLSFVLFLAAALCAFEATFATPYMVWASATYYILCIGLVFRRRRGVHACLMTSGIVSDLALVLTLEIQRSAIAEAVSMSLPTLGMFHVGASFLATALYFPVLVLGARLYFRKGPPSLRVWHEKLGWTVFFFRTLGFILMFSLLSKSP